jgi:tetratricopeptide (TPR) repeat protein
MTAAEKLIKDGYRRRREHRLDDAMHAFTEAVTSARAAADSPVLARALVGLARIERDRKHLDEAYTNYAAAEQIVRTLDDALWLAHVVRHLGDVHREQGRFAEAAPRYAESLSIYRNTADPDELDFANALRGAALNADVLDERTAARHLWREARALYASAEIVAGVEESDRQVARLS